MTGFVTKNIVLTAPSLGGEGMGDGVGAQTTLAISVKSVNARFFETTFRMPHQLYNLEVALEKRLRKRLYRGHVYLSIHVGSMAIFKGKVQTALSVIDSYMHAINTIKSRYSLSDSVTLDTLLQLPALFTIEESMLDQEGHNSIIAHVDELIDELVAVRVHEGEVLRTDIEQRINLMQGDIQTIELRAQELVEYQKTKINSVMQELQGQENALADMRKNALCAVLDKIDIHEEMVRFKSHIENIKKQITSTDVEKGKKLDFTLQELMREINTITAKCSDASIGTHAINIKVEIEKMREQIQNIV